MSHWQSFDPRLRDWFERAVGAPTAVQRLVWPVIADGEHVLLSAPTGAGKTLAACLWALNQLCTAAWDPDRLRVVYVSPLKALGSDIERNLRGPLQALQQEMGEDARRVHLAVRSGDTDPRERARMARRPPAMLVTTPESLNLLLASRQWRHHFDGLRQIIVDEVHAVADSKRGTWLMNAIEGLSERAGDVQRVALSATVRPLDRVADLLGGRQRIGADHYRHRQVRVLVTGERRIPELRIEGLPGAPQDPHGRDERDPDAFWQ
ncbi:MAG: DEAD/DEAH box helicase, partial [Planctomycetota bacterium]